MKRGLILLALVAACGRKPAARPEVLHCRSVEVTTGDRPSELFYTCSRELASCQHPAEDELAADQRVTRGDCASVAPAWHCHEVDTPRIHSEACFPAAAQCEEARHHNYDGRDTGKVTAGPCHPVAAVTCYDDRGQLHCYSSATLCQQERSFISELFPRRLVSPCGA